MTKLRFTYIFFVMIGLTLWSCKASTPAQESPSTSQETPTWLMDRPLSSVDYIGIGGASKVAEPLEYAQVAKKNALNDLASEISVVVKSESLLNTLEVNRDFQEEFISNISTSTHEKIEGFELIDSYETETEIWMYYRLSKSKHASIKAEQKKKVLSASYDLFQQGKLALEEGNIPSGLNLHIRALLKIKEYWAEVNKFEVDGITLYLDNEIYRSLRGIFENLHVTIPPNSLQLNHENGFQKAVDIQISYRDIPATDVLLSYDYDRSSYHRRKQIITDAQGFCRLVISETNTDNQENNLDLLINPVSMLDEDVNQKLALPLLHGLRTWSKTIPIEIEMPTFYFLGEEKNFGSDINGSILRSALQNALQTHGIEASNSPEGVDYWVELISNTTQGGVSQGFHVAYLEMTLTVVDPKINHEVFRKNLNRIKGIQLNFNAAGLEAYKKVAEKIQVEIVAELLEALI